MSTSRRSLLVQLAALGAVSACNPTKPADSGDPRDSSSPDSDTDSVGDSPHDSDTGTPWDEQHCDAGDVDLPEDCEAYPPAGEGPFYRENIPERTDLNVWDEEGVPLIVLLRVTELCVPIEGARVELWHAGQNGVYDTESADYNGYGAQTTDLDGKVCFQTIRPPSYPSNPEDPESPMVQQHIHLKLWVGNVLRANSQLQFADDPVSSPDPDTLRHELEDLGGGLYRLTASLEMESPPA